MFLITGGCSHLRPSKTDAAVIEFERQEDNGFVNVVPCTLVLSDGHKVTLSGGERAAVSVQPGSVWVDAFSHDPYSLGSDARAWRSSRTTLQVEKGQRLQFLVEPTASGSTYTGGWTIQVVNSGSVHDSD